MQLIKLAEDYSFGPFDCGEPDLNDFLLTDAKDYASQLLAVTYLIESTDAVGFYESNGFLLLNSATTQNVKTIPMYYNLRRLA